MQVQSSALSAYVPLADLARELGLDRSNVRTYILAAGFEFARIRTRESRGQLTLALSVEDAEAVRELRAARGFGQQQRPILIAPERGVFYLIQLVPDLDLHRIKLGFAGSIEERLQAHRTAAPTAELVQTWPCRRSWEVAAIASITRVGCRVIGQEVFDCDNVEAMMDRAASFFALMPSV